jgi:hypothetical protein
MTAFRSCSKLRLLLGSSGRFTISRGVRPILPYPRSLPTSITSENTIRSNQATCAWVHGRSYSCMQTVQTRCPAYRSPSAASVIGQEPEEKRKLVRVLVSNSSWKAGRLIATVRRGPF